jgi:dGTPase
MKKHDGSFEHNEQSHRIVTVLAEHSSLFPGLNLNQEVLEGLLKHRTPHDGNSSYGLPARTAAGSDEHIADYKNASLEAQIVNLADEIAYTGHDSEDGLRADLFSLTDIRKISFVDQAMIRATPRGTALRGAIIHMLVTDLLMTTQQTIDDQGIRTIDDVYAQNKLLAHFSEKMVFALQEIREFLWQKMYLHPEVTSKSHEGQVIIEKLCDQYMIKPDQRIDQLISKNNSALPEAIKDYVSGMTDAYAISSIA